MPGVDNGLGKKAEEKIKEWLDRPEDGYSIDRLIDQMNGFKGSYNICDFICFKSPYFYYIESKATYEDRFDFNRITEFQHDNLLKKSKIKNVFGVVVVVFANYQKAFMIDIREIDRLEKAGVKSLNIKKQSSWDLNYYEIPTLPSRKMLLDYVGGLPHEASSDWCYQEAESL